MRIHEAQIEWNSGSDDQDAGLVLVFERGRPEHVDSPIRKKLHCSGGACYSSWADLRGTDAILVLIREFHMLVVRDKVPAEAVHKEFLKIDEYRDFINANIEGATPLGEETYTFLKREWEN